MSDGTAGLSAHDAAMIQVVDSKHAAVVREVTPSPPGAAPAAPPPAAAPAKAARPEHIPEKFWDADKGEVRLEEMARSYVELERKTAQPAPKDPPKDPPKGAEGDTPKDPAQDPPKGLDLAALETEFNETGKLSDASFEALAKIGLSREYVETYIAGQVALAAAREGEAFSLAGGAEQYAAMIKWAGANLQPEAISAFDTAVMGTKAQMQQAITSLRAQYTAAVGNDPTLVNGSLAGNAGGPVPFASRAEVVTAMRDPRYSSDPAYRAEVEARVGAMSNW